MTQDAVPYTFVAESRELLRDMESALLTMERTPQDTDAINAVFRAMHTIKGTSGVFGFDVIVEVTHVMESLVEAVRCGQVPVDKALVALLLECGDHVSSLIDSLEGADPMARLEEIRQGGTELLARVSRLDALATPLPARFVADAASASQAAHCPPPEEEDTAVPVVSPAWHISARFGQEVLQQGMDPLSVIRYLSTLGEVVSVDTLFEGMPEFDAMDPQSCYVGVEIRFAGNLDRHAVEGAFDFLRDDSTISVLQPHAPLSDYRRLIEQTSGDKAVLGDLLVAMGALTPGELARATATQRPLIRHADNGADAPPDEQIAAIGPTDRVAPAAGRPDLIKAAKTVDHRSIRIDSAKLDELINLVGELVIASAGVSLSARNVGDGDLHEAAANMGRLVEQVRDGALTLRMVPIGETFNRFSRVVHDLGAELGKDVELVISGAETELDKSMVEKLSDPLMHLVRNALDHGIENAERRTRAGKHARGRITLNAYHETGNIVIEVADDGAGLDSSRILARALETGLVHAEHALAEHDVLRLVMEPGFSTAPALTNVSGRGVGMDVVRRNVEALRGSVTIDSVPNEGTVMALRVPLTLAIIEGFMVGVGRSSYVIPLEMVVECLELSALDREGVRDGGYINLRGDVLPLLRMRDVFDVEGEPAKRENIVVVQYGGQQAGFVVDALLGEFQTVIKPLGKLFERLAGISGSTILGTGAVALILDVQALVERAVRRDARQTAVAEHAERPIAVGQSEAAGRARTVLW